MFKLRNLWVAVACVTALTHCGKNENQASETKATNTAPAAKAPEAKKSIYGTWGTFSVTLENDNTNYALQMKVEPESLSALLVCTYADGTRLSAVATAKAQVTDKQIHILEEKQSKTTDGVHTCRATIHAETMDYVVNGDTADFSGKGAQFTFKRIQ